MGLLFVCGYAHSVSEEIDSSILEAHDAINGAG
jgi:hypothetical protein